jgi:hypothetical protein
LRIGEKWWMEATPHLLLFLSPRGANLSTAYQKMVCLTKEKARADSVAQSKHIAVPPGSGICFCDGHPRHCSF